MTRVMTRRLMVLPWLLVWPASLATLANWNAPACAQSGLREALERLDKNQDGTIEPDEITPLARPYLERIMRARRMSIDRPNEIDKLQEAARAYSALRNGVSGRDVNPEGESSVKPFGPDPDQPLVPEFGLARVKYPYTQDDLDFADRTLARYDRNGDGHIDRVEAEGNKWTHRNPFDDDLDNDNRLSRLELGQRYARRRLLDGATGELVKKAWRTGSGVRPSTRPDAKEDASRAMRNGGGQAYLAGSVIARFDRNRNGRLEPAEAQDVGIPVGRADRDQDGGLSRSELYLFLVELQDEMTAPAVAMPPWFYELDSNRDGQIEMFEFSSVWTDAKLLEFEAIDANGDALLTAEEVARNQAAPGTSYRSPSGDVLPPRKTIISEIEVEEDYVIGDLNVELSITHSNVADLDAYLMGPDGQRIELFTEVGGSGNNFEQTTFDDASPSPITKAKAPYRGTFAPEGVLKQQPGLSHFNGRNINGVWQLMVRATRSERFGMLHRWSLIVRRQDEMPNDSEAEPLRDGPQAAADSSDERVRGDVGNRFLNKVGPQTGRFDDRPVVTLPDAKDGRSEWKFDLKPAAHGDNDRDGGARDFKSLKLWINSQKPGKQDEER